MSGASLSCGKRAVGLMALLAATGCAWLPAPDPVTLDEPRYDVGEARPARWALVLSSGAMRGFAHVGALRELEAAGLVPDLIVGTSSGAIVGALAASGLGGEELERAAMKIGRDVFVDWTLPYTGLVGGRGIHAFVDRHARLHRIEDFPIRFAAVSVEAEGGCLQVFNAGDPGKAVQASSTVPVLLAPAEISSKRYLDGGLISPVPVRVARLLGAKRVVAIDVTFNPAERPFLNIADAFWRSTLVMHHALALNEALEADLVIAPRLPPESGISLANRRAAMESGARAVRDAVPAIRKLIDDDGSARIPFAGHALAALACGAVRDSLQSVPRQSGDGGR